MPSKAEATWVVASDLPARLVQLSEVLGERPAQFTARFGRGWKQFYQWKKGKQLPPRRVLEVGASENGWPLEMFQEGGPMPATVVQASVKGGPSGPGKKVRAGGMVVGERRYATPYGASVREAVDKIIEKIAPEDIQHVAAMEVADAASHDVPMSPKRILWWIARAYEAGQRSAHKAPRQGRQEAG